MTGTDDGQSLPAEWISNGAAAQPVFIVGMNGSGTTMLLDCLGRHSGLYGFPRETRLIPHLISVAPRYQPLSDDANFAALWHYAAGLAQFRMANGGEPKPLPPGWQRCSRDLAGLLNMLFLTYAWDEGREPVHWCEKSPHNAQHMLRLAALYPAARFIHVIRDGRDCAYSFHRRWRRAPQLTMTRWKLLVRTARDQGRTLGPRYLEVHYEDLTRSPELWMRRICRFLGLAFEPDVLESSRPYLSSASDATGGLQKNSGRWRDYFSPRMAQRLERIGGRTLDEFGYVTAEPGADHMPARWRRHYWRGRDFTFQLLTEIHMRLRGRIERPWWTILIRPLNAYRQARENRF